ncbi:MAG: hypothetical protein LC808_36305, partial [Actinobacteria bacterium]|nr:hypothetical protein [Actinomycetota bacterium]
RQRQTNQLHSALREFYPAALTAFDLAHGTLWPCWLLHPPSRVSRSASRTSPTYCVPLAANATSTPLPPRSMPRCGRSIYRPFPCSPGLSVSRPGHW